MSVKHPARSGSRISIMHASRLRATGSALPATGFTSDASHTVYAVKLNPMSIFIHDNSTEFRLEVRGTLDARVGSELVEIYRTARTTVRNVPAILDLRKVQSMEEAGHDSIELLQAQGMFVQRPVPASEPTCWLSVLRSWVYTLGGVPQPELAPEPCRIRARFTRK